ncbi:metallophosphoesterase [Rhodanobacter lindaniclasticus]
MGYDVIGDIHGHAGALKTLLGKLGYRERAGVWRHPERKALFIGDFIDRGPDQIETIRLVRGMVDAGAALAVMGNHEFNALAYHTADLQHPGEFLRAHSEKNRRQHQAFLEATEGKRAERQSILDWFASLPLWLELPGLRAVHACWHPRHMAYLAPLLQPGARLSPALIEAASRRGSVEYAAIEAILKGPEVQLPAGIEFRLGDDLRREARTRWWDAGAITLRESAIVDRASEPNLPETMVPADLRFGYRGDRPVFIGHYWMRGAPRLLAADVACVDYSAGRGEPLVAYRWSGERHLDEANFVAAR